MGLVLQVSVAEDEADSEQLEILTRRLREELLELSVDEVDFVRDEHAPEGARAAGAMLAGKLLVSLPKSVAALRSVLSGLTAWLAHSQSPRNITLTMGGNELILTNIPSAEQKRLTDLWVRANGLE